MDASEFFPSKWLKAEDVGDRTVDAIIEDAKSEDIGDDRKLVLYFVGYTKGLVLNKTNYERLKDAFGNETDDWKAKKIQLYTIKVTYKKEEVDAIRLKVPAQEPTESQPAQEPAPSKGGSGSSLLNEAFGEGKSG